MCQFSMYKKHGIDRRSDALEDRGQAISLEGKILRRATVKENAALIYLNEIR